jgi:deazaflavin-dependent oxidoreductase (nitroreductase family)
MCELKNWSPISMASPQLSAVAPPSAGSGLPPQKNPRFLNFYLAIDKRLLRLTGVSVVTWRISRVNHLKYTPSLILYTKGRKSGDVNGVNLLYFRDGWDYVVLGSVGGGPKHPNWVYNVDANPDGEIIVKRRTLKVRGRIATGDEHDRLFAKACTVYPYFKDYQSRAAPRVIPIVILSER